MEWLKNHPIDENTFTFSYIYDNFGKKIEKEMIPNGKEVVVNEDNKIGICIFIQITSKNIV